MMLLFGERAACAPARLSGGGGALYLPVLIENPCYLWRAREYTSSALFLRVGNGAFALVPVYPARVAGSCERATGTQHQQDAKPRTSVPSSHDRSYQYHMTWPLEPWRLLVPLHPLGAVVCVREEREGIEWNSTLFGASPARAGEREAKYFCCAKYFASLLDEGRLRVSPATHIGL